MSWFGFGGDSTPVAVEYNDLPDASPELVDKTRDLLRSELASDGWVAVDLSGSPEFEGMTLETKEAGDLLSYRTTGTIANCTPQDLKKIVLEKDLAKRQICEAEIIGYKLIEVVGDHKDEIIQARYSAGVPLVANRTFVFIRGFRVVSDTELDYAGTSINSEKALQDPSDVRGVSSMFMKWTQLGSDTKVVAYLSADPKGSLPAMVVNMFKTNTVKQLAAWRKLFQQE
jgi:hypothetical protein